MNSERIKLDEYLTALGQGDTSALAPAYEMTSKSLYTLCYTYFHNRDDSEDALSETYLTAVKHIGKFAGINGYNWLYTIAKNVCLNMIKKQKRSVPIDFDDEETTNTLNIESSPPPALEDESGIVALSKEILSDKEFNVLIMHAVGDYKFGDIANIFGGLEATVRWQYNNAIKKVRKEYERRNIR